jgi:hypothetical protein
MVLTSRQLDAVTAVVSSPTLRAAAFKVGCSETTLHRWCRMPSFREALAHARQTYHEVVVSEVAKRRAAELVGG